jgi:TonB family protein
MKGFVLAIVLVLCLGGSARSQIASFEKQAVTLVQQTLASDLDSELPKLPFTAWLGQLIGPQAGVIWQLTECGEPIMASTEGEQDLCACTEVNASLPDGRKVIVAVTIGTFKKGITGNPIFFHAVIERNEQLYEARRLRDLSELLLAKEPSISPATSQAAKKLVKREISLPVIKTNPTTVNLPAQADPLPPLRADANPISGKLVPEEAPPLPAKPAPPAQPQPQPAPKAPQDTDVMLDGKAITRVKPVYPANAKMMNALGTVKVRITISEDGRVVEAKAISGHMALRGAAVDAAYKWIFKPTTMNGTPIRVQGVLSFDFTNSSQFD